MTETSHLSPTLLWFRQDLRLEDNPALEEALERGAPILPVYIWCPEEEGAWPPGAASRWWLHQSLAALGKDLESKGLKLILRSGPSLANLQDLIRTTGAGAVYWNRRYEPFAIERDTQVKTELRQQGLEVRSFNASLLFEPWEIASQQGKPYQVFTPFWKACLANWDPPEESLPSPATFPAPVKWPKSASLKSLELEPNIDWAAGFHEAWRPGSAGAWEDLERFLEEGIGCYEEDRNRPDRVGTSLLSPHLHFGEISPRQICNRIEGGHGRGKRRSDSQAAACYIRELGWREFAYHLLYHFPQTVTEPLRDKFKDFPWRRDEEGLAAWHRGRTGYPLVDAGMRELWSTGWMHNRVRMIAASFLVKDLRVHWLEGARWFWDTLVDADLANNTLGWQWTAGCGADAAPYFRIFNPISQGKKFDPQGRYIRRWIPEIADLSDKDLFQPWDSANSGISKTYPLPIVDHAEERDKALEAYRMLAGE